MSGPEINKIYASEDPQFIHFPSRRSVVHSSKAMVSSTQPLASEAGYKILSRGGNAADAAVAVAAALNVTEPSSTGVGGDMFCLFYNASTKKVHALNGSGRAPAALTLQKLRDMGVTGPEMAFDDINSVTVPGAAAGLLDTLELFGSMTASEVLQPAIDLAEQGFPVSEISAYQWGRSEEMIKRASPNSAEILSKTTGHAPKSGEIMKNPTLAQTFRTLASDGKDGFYKGRIAEEIVSLIQSKGGVMTLQDLAEHTSTPCDPISISYAGLDVWEHPPNGQGLVALLALGILNELHERGTVDLGELEHNSVEYLHLLIEVLRIAFADGKQYITDSEFMQTTPEQLLSKQHLSSRADVFDPKACANVKYGSPEHSSDTVYFCVVDAQGNACSFIISNYAGFGTAAVPKGCGFTLQNRGCNFTLIEGHPNCIAPRKRPYHTIIPAMVTLKNELWAAYGVMAGFMQPQGHVQVLCNMIHCRMNPQAALDAPRFCINAATDEDGVIDANVLIEDGVSEDVIAALRKLGHKVEVVKHWQRGAFGRGQVIRSHVDADGQRVLSGGSDPRGDGAAIPVFC